LLNRLKRSLEESFVGAICLGYLFAQGFIHLAYVLTAPVAGWISRKEYSDLRLKSEISTKFYFQDALPELARAVSLLLLGYILLRWLYFKPVPREAAETALHPAQH
jgi:hypothetical protein